MHPKPSLMMADYRPAASEAEAVKLLELIARTRVINNGAAEGRLSVSIGDGQPSRFYDAVYSREAVTITVAGATLIDAVNKLAARLAAGEAG